MTNSSSKGKLVGGLLAVLAMTIVTGGCKDDDKQEARAEAAQAKAEVLKLRAEMLKLKGKSSYLREQLQTTTQGRDNLQWQMEQLLEEHNVAVTDFYNAQEEVDHLKAMLAEQTKKALELQEQVDRLKAVIRELQVRFERQDTNEIKMAEDANELTVVSEVEPNM
jgi:chromosome segregation ATPase